MIKGILFDFAGVIGSDGHTHMLDDFLGDWSHIHDRVRHLDNQADKGAITEDQYISELSLLTGLDKNLFWPESKKRIIIDHEILAYTKELRKSYKVGLLSNYNNWLDRLFEEHGLHQYFDSVFISHHHKLIKPDKEAFEKALELIGLDKSEAVFVDDRQINVDGGNSFGLKSFMFTSLPQLKNDFMAFGIG